MTDVSCCDAGLCITCTDGDACQCESRPSHTLTPPHSAASTRLLCSARTHSHPNTRAQSQPHPQSHPTRHRCSPVSMELPGLESWQQQRRRCLSQLVGRDQAALSPQTRLLLSASPSKTFWPRRHNSVWHRCSLASLSEFSQVKPSLPSTVYLFWGKIIIIVFFGWNVFMDMSSSSTLLASIKLK